jgi:hypothetical protein
VRLGALDNRELDNPESPIWTASAPSWAWFDHKKPHFRALGMETYAVATQGANEYYADDLLLISPSHNHVR